MRSYSLSCYLLRMAKTFGKSKITCWGFGCSIIYGILKRSARLFKRINPLRPMQMSLITMAIKSSAGTRNSIGINFCFFSFLFVYLMVVLYRTLAILNKNKQSVIPSKSLISFLICRLLPKLYITIPTGAQKISPRKSIVRNASISFIIWSFFVKKL